MRPDRTVARVVTIVGVAAVVAAAAAPPAASQGRGRRGFSTPPADVEDGRVFDQFNVPYDGTFAFIRLRYSPLRVGWRGDFFRYDYYWDHDYPRAERHFTRLVSELTTVATLLEASNILALDDPELMKYPVAYLSEPGYWSMTEGEVEALRAYLLKGGFVIFDDFAGAHWYNFEEQLRRVLPDLRLVRLDATHPIFHAFYDIDSLDEFVHPLQRVPSSFYGVFEDNDPAKRLLLIANYDNDIGDAWEWSDTGFLPIDLTNEAYKLGINYIVYAMTH